MAKLRKQSSTTKQKATVKSTAKQPKPAEKKAPEKKTVHGIGRFITKAISNKFKGDEFEKMAKEHFKDHDVEVEFFNAYQCYVLVDGKRIQRNGEDGVFIGRAY